MIVYAGIDEAGYGPMLGPLCFGLTVLEFEGAALIDRENPPADLWDRFRGIVCRKPSEAGTERFPVDDSKSLKLPNSSRTRDPLTHLERGVLASVIAWRDTEELSDESISHALGIRTSGLDWYEGDAIALPLGTTGEHIRLLASRFRRAMEDESCAIRQLRCACVDERVFNRLYENSRSKSRISARVLAELVRELVGSCRDHQGALVRLVIDRQGGRRSYAPFLRAAIGTDRLEIVQEGESSSEYLAWDHSGNEYRVRFRTGADTHEFTVALSSMIAKLVRELMMRRFNRYFCARNPELKPTAGYVADARRWLADASGLITPEERALLVRKV